MNPLDIAFPPRISCLICGDERGMDGTDDLCVDCRLALPYAMPPLCVHCGRPFADGAAHVMCIDCERHAPAYDQARAALLYTGVVPRMVRGLKFSGVSYWARFLAAQLASVLEEQRWGPIDCIVPVPLHAWRRFRRGYNQATLIARHLSRLAGIPVRERALRRVRHTRMQSRLSARQRRSNLVDAFRASVDVRGATVLLLDDVMTTGETLSRCAEALRDAGCARIYALSVATSRAEGAGAMGDDR